MLANIKTAIKKEHPQYNCVIIGMPLQLLAEYMGHASVVSTQIYAYADTEMKRRAIEKCQGGAAISAPPTLFCHSGGADIAAPP